MLPPEDGAVEAALQHKGLVVLGNNSYGSLILCRAIDSHQNDPTCLDVSSCGLEECCILEGEEELQHLCLAHNALSSLPAHATAPLSALTALDLSRNRLLDLPGLAHLTQLRVLNLARNRLNSLDHITGLVGLEVLDVHHNALSDLGPVQQLTGLAVLNAAANRVHQLPCLSHLTRLSQLNLRGNSIRHLQQHEGASWGPSAAAAAGGSTDRAGSNDRSGWSGSQCSLLPASLVRLSLAHNCLAHPGLLLPLWELPALADLCVDGNTPSTAVSSSSSSSSTWSRDGVLSCCPPSLLMLDMQPVSPSERVLILTAAVKLNAAQRSSNTAAAAPAARGLPAATSNSALCAASGLMVQALQQQRSTSPPPGQPYNVQQPAAPQQQQPTYHEAADQQVQTQFLQALGRRPAQQARISQQQQHQQQEQEEQQHLSNQHQVHDKQQQVQQHEEEESQQSGGDDFRFSPVSSATAAAAAADASEVDSDLHGVLPLLCGRHEASTPPTPAAADAAQAGTLARTVPGTGAAGAAGDGADRPAGVLPLMRPGLAAKLRPHSAGDVVQRGPTPGVSSSAGSSAAAGMGGGVRSSAHAGSSSSGGVVRGLRAGRACAHSSSSSISPPNTLTAYAAFAACRAGTAAAAGTAVGVSASGSAAVGVHVGRCGWSGASGGDLQEPHLPPPTASGDDRPGGDVWHEGPPGTEDGNEGEVEGGDQDDEVVPPATAVVPHTPAVPAAAPAAPTSVALTDQAAAAAAAAVLAAPAVPGLPVRYEGRLAHAAVVCGVMLPESDAWPAAAAGQHDDEGGWHDEGSDGRPGSDTDGWPAAGTGAAGAGGGEGVISAAELEGRYLRVNKAHLTTDRQRRLCGGVTPPPPHPSTRDVQLHGSRLLLSGNGALAALRGDCLAHTSDLTLAHMDYGKVVSGLPLLTGLSRLAGLTLTGPQGLCRLPQLHPLLQLTGLRHLTVAEAPLCDLVLLRPYVAFRFPGLACFNGTPLTPDEVVAGAELFGPLEAALAAALGQAPQQAALAASGILKGNKAARQTAESLNATSSSAAAGGATASGSVWCPNSTGESDPWTAADGKQQPAVAALMQKQKHQQQQRGASSSAAAAGVGDGPSCVSQVFAAMTKGPLLPPGRVMAAGSQFAVQLLSEAVAVQVSLSELHDTSWPGLVERSIHEGWSGHYEAAAHD